MYEDAQNAIGSNSANYPMQYLTKAEVQDGVDNRMKRTVRENLDAQIKALEVRLEELKETKSRMETSGVIDMRIDDLQQAMRF